MLVPLLLSCGGRSVGDSSLSPYVNDILAGRNVSVFSSLSAYSEVPSGGCIYIIGERGSCGILSGKLLGCDSHDNVSGRKSSDDLPDFAGETVVEVNDDAAAPYFKYLDENGAGGLSALFTRHVVNSLDTVCSLTCYDVECKGYKPVSKVLVFTDPLYARYARRDVEALLEGTSCALPVLCPIDLAFDELLPGNGGSFNIGIVCGSSHAGFSAYREILEGKTGLFDNVNCFSYSPEDMSDVLIPFLNAYRDNGGRDPLDALIVDNADVDMSRLESDLSMIRDLSLSACVTYGKLVSSDFKVIDSYSLVAERCYSLLRSRNLFTHRISYPACISYRTADNPDNDSNCFLLVPEDDV